MSDSLRPRGLYSPWNSPGKKTGVGCHCLLQGIFPAQDQIQVSLIAGDSLPAEPPGKPKNLPAMQETLVRSPDGEYPLEEG